MTKKLLPYINKFTGEVAVLTKSEGSKLSEDWSRAKMAKNEKGEKVFRFQMASEVKGKDGRMHLGTVTVDLSENKAPEAAQNGKRDSE